MSLLLLQCIGAEISEEFALQLRYGEAGLEQALFSLVGPGGVVVTTPGDAGLVQVLVSDSAPIGPITSDFSGPNGLACTGHARRKRTLVLSGF